MEFNLTSLEVREIVKDYFKDKIFTADFLSKNSSYVSIDEDGSATMTTFETPETMRKNLVKESINNFDFKYWVKE